MIFTLLFTYSSFLLIQLSWTSNEPLIPLYLHFSPKSLDRYGYRNNFPNYYPSVLLNGFDGRTQSMRQLNNEIRRLKASGDPNANADNIVNRSLMQTWAPTCLHDLIYCLHAQRILKTPKSTAPKIYYFPERD
uniref:Uncharacterized protein n=1 Tax=Rhabditophanes sp. KR3021 TaxID=114890 RepID=A0AC35TQ38_9BILA